MNITYPTVCQKKDGRYFIDFYINTKRYRLFTAQKIGLDLKPNNYPIPQRKKKAELLAKLIYDHLIKNNNCFEEETSSLKVQQYDSLIKRKLNEPLSERYKESLIYYAKLLREQLIKHDEIPIEFIDGFLNQYTNNTSFNTHRRHINVLANYLNEHGFKMPITKLKRRRQTEKLHKPINDISHLLNLMKEFNYNLYLCCLLTYGCLLRPHREIRLLKWKDFSEDLSTISIAGDRVKSKKNRIVPVPKYIREILLKTDLDDNIFTGNPEPYNRDYFKTVFSRFKRCFPEIDKHVTIYSFRHSGAIEIFKRTGSLTKLQRAMGHSSLQVSLTYLRGLEVTELKEEDMPMV
ncbi:MAG: tyrosine-type recombinase/integrase [Flavobacteriaceae bacterium]|nr:tyrosine-type recombinase/integrase [Flavobacteriaceae bacterium]